MPPTAEPTLVILAAGAGRRYGGLKQLAPIGPGGEALLEYTAFDARRAGFGRVVLVVSAETEGDFRARLDGGMAQRVPVAYVHQRLDDLPVRFESCCERRQPWGTGQAVLAAEPEIDGPFAVVNADDFYGAESYVTLARFLAQPQDGRTLAAVGFRVGETLTDAGPVSRALLEVGPNARLLNIAEHLRVWREDGAVTYRDRQGLRQPLDGDALVSMNMWGCPLRLLVELRRRFVEFLERPGLPAEAEYLLPEVVQAIVRDGRFQVEVLTGNGDWCGITFREDQDRVGSIISSLIEQGHYPKELWE
jgi:hypothetical protein